MFKKRGFTLVEVLLVIIIVGILAAIVIPRIIYNRQEAERQACNANVAAMNAQIELYHMQTGNWTTNLNDLVPDYVNEVPTCPWNTTYIVNATTRHVIRHAH